MDDLEKYIAKRKKRSAVFAQDFDAGYEEFKIGIVLQAGEGAGRYDSGRTGAETSDQKVGHIQDRKPCR